MSTEKAAVNYFWLWIKLLCIVVLCSYFINSQANLPSIAFYYGNNPPAKALQAFNVAVIEPDSHFDPKKFSAPEHQAFAYISLGEIKQNRKFFKKIPKNWFISYNHTWKTDVIDQSNPQWQQFFLEQVITPLWNKGYRGFFLDTLDSYQLVAKTESARHNQIAGIINIIKTIKNKYPEARLIFNRGFELLPQAHSLVYAMAAESLFGGWDQAKGGYYDIKPNDREYLLKQLKQAQSFGLPIIVIDYASPKETAKAREIISKIKQLGFIPWVADGQLKSMGVNSADVSDDSKKVIDDKVSSSTMETSETDKVSSSAMKINDIDKAQVGAKFVPRKILIVYDTPNAEEDLMDTEVFGLVAMPLEYLGYVPVFTNIAKSLPNGQLKENYAGILIWLNGENSGGEKLIQWVKVQIQQKLPVVFMNRWGVNLTTQNMGMLGLNSQVIKKNDQPLQIVIQDKKIIGFEAQPPVNPYEFIPITTKEGKVLLKLKNGAGQIDDAIAITKWGGYALSPYVVDFLPFEAQSRWIINPFAFFRQALRLPQIPVPDTTTLAGRRIMMVHIDGDGFMSKGEWMGGSFAGEELRKLILDYYHVPTTVSIIEGELAPDGKITEQNAPYIESAKQIFKLPWVEIASHTFSHPFDWRKVSKQSKPGEFNLAIPNYQFNLQNEVTGSVDFINRNLAPPGKLCQVYLWSGDANPTAEGIALTYKNKLQNLNGGYTVIDNMRPSLTNIAPLGVDRDGFFQVFASIQNEVSYTHDFHGPFYGFLQVINTLKRTDSPRRIKPIDIYYHFFSLTKPSSLMALNKIYLWALQQPVNNIYVSEFSKLVLDFNQLKIFHYQDGWLIRSQGQLHEFRVLIKMGYPDLERSQNVVGFNRYHQYYYVHLGPTSQTLLYFNNQPPQQPYLVSANGQVTEFSRTQQGLNLRLQSYLPLNFVLANMNNCSIVRDEQTLANNFVNKNQFTYILLDKDSHDLSIRCRQ